MRKIFFISALFFIYAIFGLNAYAIEDDNKEIEFSLTESFASRHICEAQDSFPEDDPVWETSLDATLNDVFQDSDLSLGIWWGYPLESGNVAAEEIDYTIALSHTVADRLDLSFGYSYGDFPKANRDSDFNKFYATLALDEIPNLPIKVAPHMYLAYQFEAAAEGPEDGWYLSWGFTTGLSLPVWKIFQKDQGIYMDITNWGTDGVASINPNFLYATEYSLSTDYNFSAFTITPSFHYLASYDEDINSEDEVWGRIDIHYAF